MPTSPSTPGRLGRDARQTSAQLWWAVALLVLAAGCLGGFVVALHDGVGAEGRVLLGGAVVLGVVGLALAKRHHIMRDTA